MSYGFCRRLIAVTVAALFLFSALAHAYAATAMIREGGGMTMPIATSETASHEDGSPCPPSDCSKDMPSHLACFAHCATVIGILAEPVIISVSITGHRLDSPVVPSLASLHGPPEPPPPKSHA